MAARDLQDTSVAAQRKPLACWRLLRTCLRQCLRTQISVCGLDNKSAWRAGACFARACVSRSAVSAWLTWIKDSSLTFVQASEAAGVDLAVQSCRICSEATRLQHAAVQALSAWRPPSHGQTTHLQMRCWPSDAQNSPLYRPAGQHRRSTVADQATASAGAHARLSGTPQRQRATLCALTDCILTAPAQGHASRGSHAHS